MRIPTTIAIATALLAAAGAHAEVSSWKIINGRSDPLTEKSARTAVSMAKSSPIFHGQPVTAALVIRCETVFLNKPAEPELMLLFTGLNGLGRVRSLLTHYRWDEGPVRGYTLKSIGANGTRAVVLPKLVSLTKLVEGEDPIADMIAAKRLRAEVQFASEGTIVVDFNVAGANDAIRAVSCH